MYLDLVTYSSKRLHVLTIALTRIWIGRLKVTHQMWSEGFEFDQPFVKRPLLPYPRFVHHCSLSIILTDGGRGVLPIRAYTGRLRLTGV